VTLIGEKDERHTFITFQSSTLNSREFLLAKWLGAMRWRYPPQIGFALGRGGTTR
jgi:hypothetical protein